MEIEEERSLFKRREPFKFMLKLGILGSIILFCVIMSFFSMRGTKGGLPVPMYFHFSTLVVLLSSLVLNLAKNSFLKSAFKSFRNYFIVTIVLGSLFLLFQIMGWFEIKANASGKMGEPFVYVLSGLHFFHILGGLLILLTTYKKSIFNKNYLDTYIYSVNPPNVLKLNLTVYYWHFVDLLWIFIYLFFLYNQR